MSRVISSLTDLGRGTPVTGHDWQFGPNGWESILGQHINLRAWGGSLAVDGTGDWTDAIDDAMATAVSRGVPILATAGIHVYDGTLTIPHRLHWIGPGAMFDEGADKASPLRATLKLADGANVDFIKNDPTGPIRGGQDTPHAWQRSLIKGLYIDCNGSNQTGTCHGLHFYRAWGITLQNVMVLSARGINIYLDDINEVNGYDVTAIDPAGVTTSQLYLKDSADSIWQGFQGHGAKGPLLVFDNTIACLVDGRIGYTINASTDDEYLVVVKNNSRDNTIRVNADKPYLDGLYVGSNVVANDISIVIREMGYQNATGRSAARVAGSHNKITVVSRPTGAALENDVSGVVVEANADNNDFTGSAVSGFATNWDISPTGTSNNRFPFGPSSFLGAAEMFPFLGTPTLALAGATPRRPAWLLAVDEAVAGAVVAPAGWTKARFVAFWTNVAASSGTVGLTIAGAAYGAGETLGADTGSADVETAAGAIDVITESMVASASNYVPCVPGELLSVRIRRTAASVSELGNDIALLGVRIELGG